MTTRARHLYAAAPLTHAVDEVPLFDIARELAGLRLEAAAIFERIWTTASFTFGAELDEFEERFADFCGAEHCVGISDGTAAIQLGLLALGVEPGSRVVTVPNTFVATVEAIAATGAEPRLVDVDRDHRCMDSRALGAAVDAETAAVVPVHLFGRLAPMDEISEICERSGVPVLEDAAQAHGASLRGMRAGAWGDAAAFSFYPSKNLGAAGDAGAVVCRGEDTADALRSLRHHGSVAGAPNRHVLQGGTHRLDNLQAALLVLRLSRLHEANEQRRRAAALYRELLAELPLTLPMADGEDEEQVYHLFVIDVEDRDEVLSALRARGIGAAVHYPTPIHLQPAWHHLGYGRGDFPVAEHLAEHCLSLPCFAGITEEEQIYVAQELAEALHR
ncbi:MAG TPA: DegT/DnrJ/EryC1/StrS family aminotransferase [Solirubrobacteraceae bacterium]|nr:DegT/DnrJ/EryC1/StrS family aminotransferase [Solirubrobacteraceae bacterium]